MIVGLIIFVLFLGVLAVAGLEVWQAFGGPALHGLKAWAAWTPLVMAGVTALTAGAGPEAALWSGFVIGPLAYPAWRFDYWFRWERTPILKTARAAEQPTDVERMRYHAMDFDGATTATRRPSPPGPPPEDPPPTLWPPRPIELGVFTVSCVAAGATYGLLYAGGAFAPPPTGPELVAATLEARGYFAPHVYRATGSGADVCGGRTYYWTAAGAEGGACADEAKGLATIWVERTWTRAGAAPEPP